MSTVYLCYGMRMCVCVGKRIGFMFKMAEKLQEMISSDWRYFNIQEFSNNHCYCVPVTRWLDIIFFYGLDLRHANIWICDFCFRYGVVTSIVYVGLHSSGYPLCFLSSSTVSWGEQNKCCLRVLLKWIMAEKLCFWLEGQMGSDRSDSGQGSLSHAVEHKRKASGPQATINLSAWLGV